MSDPLPLEITDIANGGQGIGRYKGRPIFVPFTIPGEEITARIVDDHGKYAFGEGVQVLVPSQDRVLPLCHHFGPKRCGGCQWQHMTYEAQLALKTDIVADQLSRIGGFDDVPVPVALPSPSQWAYSHQAVFFPLSGGKLGYKTADGEKTITIEDCPVVVPEILDLVAKLDLDLPTLNRVKIMDNGRGDQMLILSTSDDEPPELELDLGISVNFLTEDKEPANLIGTTHLIYQLFGRSYRVTAGSFFRSNFQQIETLVNVVIEMLRIQGNECVLDLYAGVGLFASVLAPKVSLVTCVESYPPAANDAEENLRDLDNVDVIEGSIADVLPDLEEPYQIVVLDPPPQGMNKVDSDAVGEVHPDQIVYIGQDPAILARDTRRLVERFGYTLEVVQPIDFEPQTFRTVSVAYLAKEK